MRCRRWNLLRTGLAIVTAGALALGAPASKCFADPGKPDPEAVRWAGKGPRNFRTFLPKSGDVIQDASAQVVQLLLDRQDKGSFDSYMVQVLFRGKPPAEHAFRAFDDRVEIDFYDTGKPSMRLAKVRGGAVEASSLEELFYREARAAAGEKGSSLIKRMVRLTLYVRRKPEIKFRDTLDRTLIHFLLPKPPGQEE
jgi:hypothetical protein